MKKPCSSGVAFLIPKFNMVIIERLRLDRSRPGRQKMATKIAEELLEIDLKVGDKFVFDLSEEEQKHFNAVALDFVSTSCQNFSKNVIEWYNYNVIQSGNVSTLLGDNCHPTVRYIRSEDGKDRICKIGILMSSFSPTSIDKLQ